jgi:hypothetical protein
MDELTGCVEQRRSLRQGYSLSPGLFNIFTDDIIVYINKGNIRAPILGKNTVPGLLFADYLAVWKFTVKGL